MAATVKARVGPQNGTGEDVRDITPETTSARIKVAVIEDDESVRQALSFQLGTAGFEVVVYSSAEELLEASDAKEFDCVVADIYLPRMNGLQLQDELRKAARRSSSVEFNRSRRPSFAQAPR